MPPPALTPSLMVVMKQRNNVSQLCSITTGHSVGEQPTPSAVRGQRSWQDKQSWYCTWYMQYWITTLDLFLNAQLRVILSKHGQGLKSWIDSRFELCKLSNMGRENLGLEIGSSLPYQYPHYLACPNCYKLVLIISCLGQLTFTLLCVEWVTFEGVCGKPEVLWEK